MRAWFRAEYACWSKAHGLLHSAASRRHKLVMIAGLDPATKAASHRIRKRPSRLQITIFYAVIGRLNMDVIDSAGVYKLADSVALNFFEEQGYNMSALQKAM